jgi:type VI secretion system secreted protein Hcp
MTKPKSAGALVRRPLLAAALAASAVASAPAMAAYNIFLKLGDIKGESTEDGHKDWIELVSYSSGVSQASVAVGNGAARAVSTPQCAPFNAKKLFDQASPTLLAAAVTGQHFSNGEVDFVRADSGGEVFIKLELNDVVVSSAEQSGSVGGDSAPTESISLSFGGVKVTYQPQKPDGSLGDPVVAQVNCP